MNMKSNRTQRSILAIFIGIFATSFCFAGAAAGQGRSASYSGVIEAGTSIAVRTNEAISTNKSDGRVFLGQVDQDVKDRAGNIVIPSGAEVELLVKKDADNELTLDLDAVTLNGRRYSVETDETSVAADRKEGIGANKRTGKYVGGGAIIGAIIGGIAGGGKGAAIGAGAGAAAGAGAQVLTRGDHVNVPAETLLTFQLQEPLRTPAAERGFNRDGAHYHQGYGNITASPAFRDGLRAGRADGERDRPRNPQTTRYTNDVQRRDFVAGYNQGYNEVKQ
jgi:hypothetical protein